MIQKNSILKPADNCGVLEAKVFHVYKGSKGKLAFCGNFLKTSAKTVKLENPIKKKTKMRAILIRTKFKINRKDGSFINFKNNALVLLKQRLTPRGKSIRGPIPVLLKEENLYLRFQNQYKF